MTLFLTFGKKARNMNGTVETIGAQIRAGIRGAEDFAEEFRIVGIRQNDGSVLNLAMFHDEIPPATFVPNAKVSFTMRTLPREASEIYGVDYALNAERVIVTHPAP